jgi:enediyne biosynthesis protein E3
MSRQSVSEPRQGAADVRETRRHVTGGHGRPPASARLRHRVISIGDDEVSFDVRGFHEGTPQARRALERHGASFVAGFNAALLTDDVDDLALRLRQIPSADRGFAYEGSAMGFGVLDLMTPLGGSRLRRLLASELGQRHVYMLHVGAGWSLARLHLRPGSHLPVLDPFLRWLSVDGFGFHHGFFAPRRYIDGHAQPRRVRGYERRAFDQGLGRSMWFVVGGDVERAARTVRAFPDDRQGDLWSGLGLASSYTTAVGRDELERLCELAGSHQPRLAQGGAFAVGARHRAGNLLEHTRLAGEVLCGRSAEDIAEIVDDARSGLGGAAGSEYERWRTRIAEHLGRTGSVVR